MPQTMQWIAGTDALAMSVAMEARFQGRTCILCGCGESGNARPFVQDKSEYPEGIPDDLMALPLCRVCLRVKSQGVPCCVCCPFTDPATSTGPETLKIALREAAIFHSMGGAGFVLPHSSWRRGCWGNAAASPTMRGHV